jgi:multidrug resistance efflux pump
MVIAAAIYIVLVWLIFFQLKLLRLGWLSGIVTFVIGVLVVAAFAGTLNALAPAGRISVGARVIEVTPNVSGQIVEIVVRPNELVKAGDVLFRIDPTPFEFKVKELGAKLVEAEQGAKQLQASVDAAVADVQAINAQLSFAEQRRDDLARLAKSNATSQFNLEDMQRQVDTSQAQLASAKARETSAQLAQAAQVDGVNATVAQLTAELDNARWELDQTTVRAAADGFVTVMALTPGDRATPSKSVLSLIVLEDIQIVGIFSQVGFQAIKPGAMVQFAFADQPLRMYTSTIAGVIRGVGEGQIAASGTLARLTSAPITLEYPVQIALPKGLDPASLRLGMSGTATVFAPNSTPFDIFGTVLLWARALAMYL